MPDDSRLLDLLVRWEECRDAGQQVAVEELCRDCPELVPALRQRLRDLGIIDEALARDETILSPVFLNVAVTFDGERLELPGYEIVQELGRGGMGVVYKARQISLDRLVALKVLMGGPHAANAAQARFKTEVEAIARLRHPHLVQVFEVGEHAGNAYYSMEYLDGGNLEQRVAERPQPQRQAAELLAILAAAMQAAHDGGVIHRDLKPANILLGAEGPLVERASVPGYGVPKIGDFGLAKRLDGPSGPTLTEHVLGTPSYMAPEQAAGRSKQVGPATDVYALGAILYHLLTGRPPFTGGNGMEVVRKVAEEDPLPLRHACPEISVDLETICLKCLRKQPGQRYASAMELAGDLRRFLAGEPILARPTGHWGRVAKWVGRRPAMASLIAVSGVAVIFIVVSSLWFAQRLGTELRNTREAHRLAVAARADLEMALARQVANALDADFRQLEMVPQSMGALLEQRDGCDGQELEGWMRVLVRREKRISGIGVAFEPGQSVSGRHYDDYCLYVFENADRLDARQLLPPAYPPPHYREREWYRIPARQWAAVVE